MEINKFLNAEIDTMIKKMEMYRIYQRKVEGLQIILDQLNDSETKEKYVVEEMNLTKAKMREVNTIIDLVLDEEVKDYLVKHYIEGVPFEVLSTEKFCSRNKMFYNIRKELRKIICKDFYKK